MSDNYQPPAGTFLADLSCQPSPPSAPEATPEACDLTWVAEGKVFVCVRAPNHRGPCATAAVSPPETTAPTATETCAHCGWARDVHTTTLNGGLAPMCPNGLNVFRAAPSSSPATPTPEPMPHECAVCAVWRAMLKLSHRGWQRTIDSAEKEIERLTAENARLRESISIAVVCACDAEDDFGTIGGDQHGLKAIAAAIAHLRAALTTEPR